MRTSTRSMAASGMTLRSKADTPPRTPALADEVLFDVPRPAAAGPVVVRIDAVQVERVDDHLAVSFTATVDGGPIDEVVAFVDGVRVTVTASGSRVDGRHHLGADAHTAPFSEWLPPFGPLVIVVVRGLTGAVAGALATTEGSPL